MYQISYGFAHKEFGNFNFTSRFFLDILAIILGTLKVIYL